ncbi:MAG: hypothetical protein PF495_07285 [Spirochaetales bacterium]|jgi:hypothetical protein|nr:hypothetical protein [Spirochaetales bacterium]
MKEALILNVINPLLRGVLICGQKGTAKSTAIRNHSTGECGLPSLHDLISSHALKEAMEVAEETRQHGIKSVVIDTANTKGRDRMKKLSTSLGGLYYKMDDLRAERLVNIVNSSLNRHIWSSS